MPGSPDLTGAGPAARQALSYGTTGRHDLVLWEDVAARNGALRMTARSAGKASYVVIALGSNVHIFVRPHRRRELAQCFETVLGSPVRDR